MISPTEQKVDMPIEGTFVGMVDRDEFDPWLRSRAQQAGAELELAAALGYVSFASLETRGLTAGALHETRSRAG